MSEIPTNHGKYSIWIFLENFIVARYSHEEDTSRYILKAVYPFSALGALAPDIANA
jgi:hypothetical protein